MVESLNEKRKWSWKRFSQRLLVVILLIYASVLCAIYFVQEKLIFHPRPISESYADSLSACNPNAERIAYTMKDGTVIKGWLVKADASECMPLLIYYGGNAEEVSRWIVSKHLTNFNYVFVNYRGYGLSKGVPSEQNLFSDALEVYDKLVKRDDVSREKIFTIGRSLGTGVATYVSSKRQVSGTILITPFESMTALAQEKYPFIPVSGFLNHKFDSESYAPEIKSPLLTFIASKDEMIPPRHAERLVSRWGGSTSTITFPGDDHASVLKNEKLFTEIVRFVSAAEH